MQLLETNKQYIVDGGNPEKVKELSKQLYYTTLASFPKRYQHAQQELQIVKQKWANRAELQLEEIGIATLFLAEVYAWFSLSLAAIPADAVLASANPDRARILERSGQISSEGKRAIRLAQEAATAGGGEAEGGSGGIDITGHVNPAGYSWRRASGGDRGGGGRVGAWAAFLVWGFAFVAAGLLVAVGIFCLVTLSDLQHDYINPHDSAASINRFLLPDMLAHAAVALLLLLFPPSLLGLLLFALNLPLLLFHARCLLAGSYTVDVTEVFVQLPELRRLWQKKVALYCILVLPVVYRWVIAATHLLVITSQPKAVRRTA
ncbi:unnamed protein product [Closterium sp. NIES-64]|nr:unnamed protein product [Closterium sp. NIES-65]CAI5969395.1 unnamed protein product [Closterium sp. NIES-64]